LRSQRKILQRGVVLLVSSLLIGLAFAYWLSRELGKLESYAIKVESGDKVALPPLGNNEIGRLGRALESMRNRLEGKEYVEELMHTLAHELKSPIAAIQGAVELLHEDMPPQDRLKFLSNVREQNERQRQLIEKLLALVAVEKQQQLQGVEIVSVQEWVNRVETDFAAKLTEKTIRLEQELVQCELRGDALLLRQALGNVLDNAIDFSPPGSVIRLRAAIDAQFLSITLTDDGVGIPDFALKRVFDRFYSLPRPQRAKSTGLGLPFVREVMLLHRGTVSIGNNSDKGTWVELRLPLQ
jgi:two-component system, OmpR family, sensor histidine kinase CreC